MACPRVRFIFVLVAVSVGAISLWAARFCGPAFADPGPSRHTAAAAKVSPTIEGEVFQLDRYGDLSSLGGPVPGIVILLEDSAGSVIGTAATDRNGDFAFPGLTLAAGDYRVVAANPPGAVGVPITQGTPNSKSDDENTVRLTLTPDATQTRYDAGFVKYFFTRPVIRTDPVLAQRDPVDAGSQPGSDDAEPINGVIGSAPPLIQRVTDDGTIYLRDWVGTQLVRVGGPRPGVLLDTTARDPVDGVRLTRFLQAATNPAGATALLALREDSTEGIYLVPPDGPWLRATILPANLPYPGVPDLVISGDPIPSISFMAQKANGIWTIFQVRTGQLTEILTLGTLANGLSVVSLDSYPVGNDNGDLAVRAHVRLPGGAPSGVDAVLRHRGSGWEVVAKAGQTVLTQPMGSPAPVPAPGTLTQVVSSNTFVGFTPQIGPDGTVVFKGIGSNFVNYFRARPGHDLEPLLPGTNWDRSRNDEQLAIAADGTVALNAYALGQGWRYFLIPASGGPQYVVGPNSPIRTGGSPASFSPDGRLFFVGSSDNWPRIGPDQVPTRGLFRSDPGAVMPVEVARPGKPLPAFGSVLLSPPAVSKNWAAFAVLLDEKLLSPGPTVGVFRVPLDGVLTSDIPLAWKGHGLPNTNEIVTIDDVYYTSDGSLIVNTRTDQWFVIGQSILTVPPTQAHVAAGTAAPAAMNPRQLLQAGADLGQNRSLSEVPGRFVSLGANTAGLSRWLFAARFIQKVPNAKQPAGQQLVHGEGLFTIDMARNVQTLVVKGDAAAGLPGAQFAGLLDALPSAAANGNGVNVVFKAALQGSTSSASLFQWAGSGAPTVVPLQPDIDPKAITDWAAGPGGSVYLRARPARSTVSSLYVATGGSPAKSVTPPQMDVASMMVNGSGAIFFTAKDMTSMRSGLFQIDGHGTVTSTASEQEGIPPKYDGARVYPYPLLAFGGNFTLRQESACGDLFFEGDVVGRPGAPLTQTRGYFRLRGNAPDQLETRLLVGLSLDGSRVADTSEIPDDQACDAGIAAVGASSAGPGVIDTFAYARQDADGRWAIYRQEVVPSPNPSQQTTVETTVLIAREGDLLADGRQIISLIPARAPGNWHHSTTPLFTINHNGEVVFWAYTSDNSNITGYPSREAIYRYSDLAP